MVVYATVLSNFETIDKKTDRFQQFPGLTADKICIFMCSKSLELDTEKRYNVGVTTNSTHFFRA